MRGGRHIRPSKAIQPGHAAVTSPSGPTDRYDQRWKQTRRDEEELYQEAQKAQKHQGIETAVVPNGRLGGTPDLGNPAIRFLRVEFHILGTWRSSPRCTGDANLSVL